jgi:hypothetical protein
MSPTPTTPIEGRLREALATETTDVDASRAVWESIRLAGGTPLRSVDDDRTDRRSRRDRSRPIGRVARLAVAASVAVAVIVAVLAVARRDPGRDVYVGPSSTESTPAPPGPGTAHPEEPSPPSPEVGRASRATAALRGALEEEQVATVAARFGLRPDSELRLVEARAATDAATAEFAELALPRLGDGDTELAAGQMAESRLRNLAVLRVSASLQQADPTSILGQYDLTVEAVAVVARILARQADGTTAGIQAAQLADVPGSRAQWLASTTAALAVRAVEDEPGPINPDVARHLQMRQDQAAGPDALADWPGADDDTRAILRATVADDRLPAETGILDRLAAGGTPGGPPVADGEAAGGPATAADLVDQARARLAELHRYEQALISRL